MLSIFTVFMLLLVLFILMCQTKLFKESAIGIWLRWKVLNPIAQIFVIVFFGYMIVFAAVKPPVEPPVVPPLGLESTPVLVESQISGSTSKTKSKDTPSILADNGYKRLSENDGSFVSRTVTNTALPWLVMPSNAVVYSGWTNYGVAEDTFWVCKTNPVASWDFIYADTLVDGAHVSSSGTLSFGDPKGSPTPHEMPDGTGIDFLAPFHSTLAMIPPTGRFWHHTTDSNSVRFTWQNFLVGRDTNNAISFQAELFINGDYTYRYAFPLHFLSFTNDFVIGAQFGGVGETFAMNNYSNLADGVDIIWDLPDSQIDTDGDGTYDIVELYYGFDPKAYTPEDWDNDGLSNNFEYYYTNSVPTNGIERLNARLFDSDGDKLPDLFEVTYTNFNAHVAHSTTNECLTADIDGDGLNNAMEMFYGTDPNQSGSTVYNDRCEVMVALISEDSSDYMMRTVTDEGSTNIILSAYNYNWETISYELNKVIDFKYSRNVESTEYYENFSTVKCTFDIQDYWKGFCYITNAVNSEFFYEPQKMAKDVLQRPVMPMMERNSGGQNVNTNGVYIFETVLSVDNLTCNDTDLDYVSPCGTYPSVTPSAILSIEADPSASLPEGATTLKVKPIDKDYTSYFEFSDTYAQTNDFYIVFYTDDNGCANLPISNYFDFADIELNDETSGASTTVTIKEDDSTVFEGELNMPSLNITYHTRAVVIELPNLLNMKESFYEYENYLYFDVAGTHCFDYSEEVELSFATNSSSFDLESGISLPYSVNLLGCSLGYTDFYFGLEAGTRCSTSMNDAGISASFIGHSEFEETVSDTDYTTVIALDLDIDSDNNSGYEVPEMDLEEEYQQENNEIGKIVKVYRGDVDNDGIPNVEDMDHGGLFVPLVIQSHPSATTAKYKFIFNNDIRIWIKDGNSGQRTNEFIRLGGDLIESDHEYSYSELFTGGLLSVDQMSGKVLYIEGLTNGTQNISCEYILEDSTLYTENVPISVLDIPLVTDYDLDGVIDDDDLFRYSTNEVYRFWINDDNDDPNSEDSGDDNPGTSSPDYGNSTLDGSRDLIDFFPVAIQGLESTIEMSYSGYDYYLKHADGDLNILLYTGLKPDEAGSYLYSTNFFDWMSNIDLTYINSEVCISSYFDSYTEDGECVILVEGRGVTSAPLVLEIRKSIDNSVVYSTILRLSLSSVEDMYRTLDLRGGTSSTDQPDNYPDSLCNDKNLFFLHGFKVTEEDSLGWNSEFFKRLYWSGSNAKFWGVTWPGDTGSPTALNFHENAADAFNTASNLANAVSTVSNKTFMAHSLGNMVVSAAIEDYGLAVDKYFMLNCAVPSEAYDSSLANTNVSDNYMLHEDWGSYTSRTWASQWYELFDLPDKRANLTWRGRFANVVSNAYNYYSLGDEVLEIKDGMPALWSGGAWHLERYAWHKQEIFKGSGEAGGTSWAGWGFNSELFYINHVWVTENIYTVSEANSLSNSVLRTAPVFRPAPSSIFSSNMTDSAVNEMLTMGVPALSHPAGVTDIEFDGFPRDISFDMEDLNQDNGWLYRGDDYEYRWLHNDLKNVAYLYNSSLFDELVKVGDLK